MSNNRPTLRQLEYFAAVAEAESFRRAAERLRVSQPALTAQIATLERNLATQLFERNRSGTRLSPRGRELLPTVRRVLEQFQELLDQADTLKHGPGGTYRLGVTPTLGPYLLPHILPTIHRRYKTLKLLVREGAPRDLESALGEGRHDVVLTPLPLASRELKVAPLFREPLLLVMSADHRLANKRRVTREDLRNEPVLTIDEHHLFHRQIEQLCERLGATLQRDYEGTSLDTLRHMVTMGMGVAFLPALYVRSEIHDPDALRITMVHGENVARTHALVWRATSPSRGLFAQIADEIRQIAKVELGEDLLPVPRR
ncbi:MAG: hydrogen peroxide-inducible genes activator [Gammaproteobacteria bacterium]|nr:hydrogen peroxide-inducible genes activator [Gammaproteobacteria bacterium]NNL99682.1 hydrogen peroxide-inducible genes activator [Gammaproteobacteria bacterium]